MSGATAARRIVDQLRVEQVARVFCVPGESYLAVIDALYDRRAEIDLISCRHEGGAAMMALATAHLSGRAGVAFVTRGPGATNASIAVHIARQASLPLVLGVGQVARRNRGREAFQEVDYPSYFAPLAKAVFEVSEPDDVAAMTAEAFALAEHGRQGPVVLALPEDVLSGTAAGTAVARPASHVAPIDPGDCDALATRLARAARPIIVIGGGPWSETAIARTQAFAASYRIPVFSAFRRADCFDNHHDSYAGFLGYGTAPTAWQRVREADCVVVIGARLDEPTTQDYTWPASGQTLLHVHPDPHQLGLNFPTALGIAATVDAAAAALAELELPGRPEWDGWCAQARADFLASEIPPPRTVVGCVGDGGMLMTGMEIATAIKYGACPVILVFNNDKYGTIEMHQQRRYPGRELGNALTNPDFAAFARSFGAFGCRVRHADEFPDALEAALGAGRLALIELAMTSADHA